MGKWLYFQKKTTYFRYSNVNQTLIDNTSKDLPFYYNKSKYRFSNGEEDFIVSLSPSYGEVIIQVTQRPSQRLLSFLDLKRVDKFEIKADKNEYSSVLLTVVNEDTQQMIEIDFKPYYKQIFKEHFTR